MPWGAVISAGANLLGGIIGGNSAQDAAQTSANAQVQAAQIAANAAKFRPVGVTTNFGSSTFGTDANGNVNSANYTLNPNLQALQNSLLGSYGGLLTNAQNLNTSGITNAGNSAIGLGNDYLATSPQQASQNYYNQQYGLLQPSFEKAASDLRNQQFATGRVGLATNGTTAGGLGQANPEQQALANSESQTLANLAANADQYGMNRSLFGTNLVTQGNNLLGAVPTLQSAYYNPVSTALNLGTGIENMGSNALTLGQNIGGQVTAANQLGAGALFQGNTNAAKTMQTVNGYNPYSASLAGIGNNSTITNGLGNWFQNLIGGNPGTTQSNPYYYSQFGSSGSGDVVPGTTYSFG